MRSPIHRSLLAVGDGRRRSIWEHRVLKPFKKHPYVVADRQLRQLPWYRPLPIPQPIHPPAKK